MREYLRLIRPRHWVKNGLIFLPIFFAKMVADFGVLRHTGLAFAAFCCASSSIYVVNDIMDAPRDRLHSEKRGRPIASGAVGIGVAWAIAACLAVVAIGLNFAAAGWSLSAWICFCAYLVANFAYSGGLKNVPILDVVILVLGYLLRLMYGSAVAGVEVSNWLYLTVMAMSFYLGLGKRRNEIRKQDAGVRKVSALYSYHFLDRNMYMCMGLTVIFYALWTVDPVVAARLGRPGLIWTVPLLLVICMKYSLNIEKDSGGDPVDTLFGDRVLMGLSILFMLILMFILYL